MRSMMEWQAIETAPKDGTRLLVTKGDSCWIAYWHRSAFGIEGWRCNDWYTENVTHWMPLPAPPVQP